MRSKKKMRLMGPMRLMGFIGLIGLISLASCKQEDDKVVVQSQIHWVEKTVAVVAPLNDSQQKARLERTAQWFLENFREAQLYDTLAVSLKLEWYNEETENLAALSKTLAGRSDVVAVIGPFGNDALAAFAPACQETHKPLITPTATSEDIIRRYAVSGSKNTEPFLWALTESDVSMTETLMSSYAMLCQIETERLSSEAHVLSPSNSYGQTFAYWAPFFAESYGIDLVDNVQYSNNEELQAQVSKFINDNDTDTAILEDMVSGTFTVLEDVQQLYDVALLRRKLIFEKLGLQDFYPNYDDPAADDLWQVFEGAFRSWFALDNLCEEKIEALGDRAYAILQGYQGFSPYADPSTGFELSYENRFGTRPLFAECKFYDALMLVGFATCFVQHTYAGAESIGTNETFNFAIFDITAMPDDDSQVSGAAWNAPSMEIYLSALERGTLLHFKGASGDIVFDPNTYTVNTYTTYVQWQIFDGEIQHRAYIGDSGSKRTGQSTAAWQFLYDKNAAERDFDEQARGAGAIVYPALSDQYAVLVQGSSEFVNYRHQADVLSMYQLLRRGGFDDDHIILIIDRSLAQDSHNPEPGIIRNVLAGFDLLGGTDSSLGYPAAVVDYDNAQLTPQDVANILKGVKTAKTPVVLPAEATQGEAPNVLLYWSGHGRAGEFTWRDAPGGEGFTSDMMRQTTEEMLTSGQCRKLFIVAEPCYSESVVRSLQGVQGVLAMTGASGSEQSWADNWNPMALVWMSDRFSQNVVDKLSEDPATSYHDLFLYCAEHTLGSHVKIVNASHFGNLYALNPKEFIVYEK